MIYGLVAVLFFTIICVITLAKTCQYLLEEIIKLKKRLSFIEDAFIENQAIMIKLAEKLK